MKNAKIYTPLYGRILLSTLIVGVILRVIFLFNAQTLDTSYSAVEWIEIFGAGALNDVCAATLGFVFMWLYLVTSGSWKFTRLTGYIIFGIIAAAFVYELVSRHSLLDQYGGVAPLAGEIVLGVWTLGFGVKLFIPRLRNGWRWFWLRALAFGYAVVILLNGIGEYYFWNEFGVRYNFIAVDYLIYTNEVIGNIFESYPIVWLSVGVTLAGLALAMWYTRGLKQATLTEQSPQIRITALVVYPVLCITAIGSYLALRNLQTRESTYVNELQANGVFRFYEAFVSNSLDYRDFYTTLPEDEVNSVEQQSFGSVDRNLHLETAIDSCLKGRNIVLITVESLSASFMSHYGNQSNITPCYDSLYALGLRFNNLFAAGNRTVRGLEAVTLSLPPCPGQSIVKRKRNTDMFSTASVLRSRGYTTTFFYGGDSYFDNMKAFFGGNSYDIVDLKAFANDTILFKNVWGVCDEDMYRKVLSQLDATADKPFFAHVMTVSNHRPFTYPDGRIDIPSDSKSRKGGVKYSDYALGEFMRAASRCSWFDNTVFVITADHCASSAGKTSIPLDKYRIPALIYAPESGLTGDVDMLCSQIDLMPTVLSLMGLDYQSQFYGRSVFEPNFTPRAYIATYQDLGYLTPTHLTVLSPVRRVEQFEVSGNLTDGYSEQPVQNIDSTQLRRAVCDYQSSSEWYVK